MNDTTKNELILSSSPIPADRISELYNSEIFTNETAEIARRRIHWMCSHCTGKTVLDVGCSQGITAILLAREGFVVTGLDSHPESITYARNASQQETEAVQTRLKWIEGDLWDLPASEMFDTVVLGEIIEHQALPTRFLEIALQHLNFGGVIVLTTPFGLHPHPDHKVSLFPSGLVEIANVHGLRVEDFDVVDGYIRMTFRRNGESGITQIDNGLLISVTERGALESQERLYSRLDDRSTQLRKKNEAAKALQKRIDSLGLNAKDHAMQLEKLNLQLKSTQAKHSAELEDIQIAQARLDAKKTALEAELTKTQTEARQQIDAARTDQARLEAEKSALEAELTKTQTEARQLIDAAQTTEARLVAEKAALEAELTKTQTEARQLIQAHQQIEQAQVSLNAKIIELEAELIKAKTGAHHQLEAAQATEARLVAEKTALEAELIKAQIEGRQQLETAQATQARLVAEKTALVTELTKAQIEARQQIETAQARLDAEKTELVTELTEAKIKASQAAEAHLNAEKTALEAKLTKAQTEARKQIEATQARLVAEKSALEAELLKTQQENLRQAQLATMQEEMYQRTVASLENKANAVKQTLSFQLGYLLMNSTKSPKNLLRLPASIWGIHKEAEKRADARGEKAIAKLGGKTFKKVIEEYTNGDFPAVESLLAKLHLRPPVVASAYTALARHLQPIDPGKAVQAARASYQIDPQPFRAKWLAFRLFEAGVILESAALLDALPKDLVFSASETKKSEEIRSLAKLWVAKPQLEQTRSPVYIPNAQSLLYVAASTLPYHTTGYTTRTHALARALSKAGIQLTVMTRPGYPWDRNDRKGTPTEQHTIVDNIDYRHVRYPSQDLPLDLYLQEAAKAIAAVAKEKRVTAIHAASNHVNALPALLAARDLGIPFHYEMRGLWELTRASKVPGYEETERFGLGLDLEAFVAKNADKVYVISRQLAEYIQAFWGLEPARISVLPNCINAEDFNNIASKAIDSFTIGYAGSLVSYEGLDLLIDAVKELDRHGTHVSVKIIGDGESRSALEQQAKDSGLADQIQFLGKQSPKAARQALACVAAICIPRKPHKVCEIIPPIKLVEAMALGKPVIVPDLAVFLGEVTEAATGYFFKAGNVKDLAKIIETCLTQTVNCRKIGAKAREWALTNRTWDMFAKDIAASLAFPVPNQNQTTTIKVLQPVATSMPKVTLKADDSEYLKIFRRAGAKGVIERILSQFSGNNRDCARELLRVGKLLNKAGCKGAEYALVKQSLDHERSSETLCDFFYVALKARKIAIAYETYREIENFHTTNLPTPDELVKLEKIRRQKICRLQLLELAHPTICKKIDTVNKRICYVLHNSLPFSSGGYAMRAQGIAKGLKAAGYEVISLTRPGFPLDIKPEMSPEELVLDTTLDGLRYVRIPSPMKPKLGGLETDNYIVAAADALEKQFRLLKPAVVIAASNYHTALPALIAARRIGIPFVYEVRGFWEVTGMSRKPEFAKTTSFMLEQLMEAGVATRADHVFTLNEPMREELINRGVPPERQITLLPNSCDLSEFNPASHDENFATYNRIPLNVPVIGYVGTFVDYEGLEDLAKACGFLKQQGIEFRLLLVGNENVSGTDVGPIAENIKEIAAEAAFSDWLIMPGRVPHEQVHRYYSLIDIAPFPRKPWPVCEMVSPMKPLEAMAMEKAVLVSSVRALSEMVVSEQTGLVFEKGNVTDLARQLKRLISDPVLRSQLGRNGRKWVEQERTWTLTGKIAADVLASIMPEAINVTAKHAVKTFDREEVANYQTMLSEAIKRSQTQQLIPIADNKIVYFLHSSLPHLSGGYATRTHGLVKGVRAANFNIVPYTRPAFPNDLNNESLTKAYSPFDDINGIRYHRIFSPFNRRDNSEIDYMLATIDAFEQVLRKEQPAIVHCRSTYLIAVPALIAAKRLGLPFVYEVSGLWELVYASRSDAKKHQKLINRMRLLETFVIKHADALITLNTDMQEELIKRGADPEKITLAPNSADTDQFFPMAMDTALRAELKILFDMPVVGYIGSFVDYEGLDDLLQACSLLVKRGVKLKLVLVGSGQRQPELKSLIKKLGLQDFVIMTGRVPHEDVIKYYSIIDVMVYPRKPWEVCETVTPMKPLEALSMEKAVLVSSVKALTDIVKDGVTGGVFTKGDIESMATKLEVLIKSPETRLRLGQAGRRWVSEHRSWTIAGRQVGKAYADAIKNCATDKRTALANYKSEVPNALSMINEENQPKSFL